MRNYKLPAFIIQAVTGILGISFVWTGHLLIGIILFAGILSSDVGLTSSRRESSRITVKLLLLLYGVMLWLIFVTPSKPGAHKNEDFDSTMHIRTHSNLTPHLSRSHTHHYPLKPTDLISGTGRGLNSEVLGSRPSSNRYTGKKTAITAHHKQATKGMTSPQIHVKSIQLLTKIFGDLPPSDFSDLKYRDSIEVKHQMSRVFTEIPENGFLSEFKNPCWKYRISQNPYIPRSLEDIYESEEEEQRISLACLPYAYILGQPKCGTSDLFERLKKHPDIRMPRRKEVRWFTRGEFTTKSLPPDGSDLPVPKHGEVGLSSESSIYSFTNSFDMATRDIAAHPDRVVTIDGGPHTLWWPTQQPDGTLSPASIPAPQIIREMQPDAKFIVTLSDPVQRLYSDYHFLEDDRSVSRQGANGKNTKSAYTFHTRAEEQIKTMKKCIRDEITVMSSSEGNEDLEGDVYSEGSPQWFRASQICAHDRFTFGKAGWGRLSIGLYVLYIEKWLEHFPPEQFLIVRLEDYDVNPRKYMEKIFKFLSVEYHDVESSEWSTILHESHANVFHGEREPILQETEEMLRDFHAPYNKLLAKLIADDGFLWDQEKGSSLRIRQIEKTKTNKRIPNNENRINNENENEVHNEKKRNPKNPFESLGGVAKPRNFISDIQRRKAEAVHNKIVDLKKSRSNNDVLQHLNAVGEEGAEGEEGEGDGGQQEGENEEGGEEEEEEGVGEDQIENNLDNTHQTNRHGMRQHFADDNGKNEDLTVNNGQTDKVHHPAANTLRGNNHNSREKKSGRPGINQPALPVEQNPPVEKVRTIILQPKRFDIEGLSYTEDGQFNEWLRQGKLIHEERIKDERDAAHQLCIAAFALDLNALKYLLWDIGIPANVVDVDDANRNAFHCVGLMHTMADAHSKSQVFSVLKGKPSWLTPYINPPTPIIAHSVLSRDIINGLSGAIEKVTQWLIRAGVSADTKDAGGHTPLHHAAIGGMESLVRVLLEANVDVDAVNNEGRTPLHYAAAYGHAIVAGMLVDAHADPHLPDNIGTKAFDIISNPGPITSDDAKQYLGITQRKPKKIERKIHPENFTGGEIGGWSSGTGGWGNKRLLGYENDMECDVDQYWADEITEEEIFNKYLARGAPVLIRGLIEELPITEVYEHDNLRANFGDLNVQVSDIPYAGKFGGAGNMEMTLEEYIDEVTEHRLVGGKHPWYVFMGHPIPGGSEGEDSLVQYLDMPTPRLIQKAFERMNPMSARGKEGAASREIYVNAQWALGGEGTGAPVHFHNTAWNALIYGAKKWILYPPHSMIMSNRQILEYFETDKIDYAKRGVKGQSCVQVAGDIMIIPESWGHGVLNLQQSVAVATEAKANLWRSKPATSIIGKLPNDNRKLKAPIH